MGEGSPAYIMELRSVETIIRALNTAKVQYLVVGGIYEPFNFAEEMSYSITVEIESDLFVPVVSLGASVGPHY